MLSNNRFVLRIVLSAICIITTIHTFPPAPETYRWLNQDTRNPFVVSFGTSISQIARNCPNTFHPEWISSRLQKLSQASNNAYDYLCYPDRLLYALTSIPSFTCHQCHRTITPSKLNPDIDAEIIKNLLRNVASHKNASSLTVTSCPICHSNNIKVNKIHVPEFTSAHQAALVAQVDHSGVKDQVACKQNLPPYRLSVEAALVLKDNSTEIDPVKLQAQAKFIKQLGNPLLVLHNYSNPQHPDLTNFPEEPNHATWFANYCAQVVASMPNGSFVCPFYQPAGFSMRVARLHELSPFTSSLSQPEHFDALMTAHVAAYDAIKKIAPDTQVLISHQWKPMIPVHNNPKDPRFYVEKMICAFASKLYNDAFVAKLRQHQHKFDGIALSIYPPVKFNMWKPVVQNCHGVIDEKHSLECIMKMHEAFPNKPIIIADTGCNHPSPEVRKQFMDMTLSICKQARLKGANVQGVYFGSHTNDVDFYREWHIPYGTLYSGFYDLLDPENPTASINETGKYLNEIVRKS